MEDNFDPDKYLAETPELTAAQPEEFDPDQYLSEPPAEQVPASDIVKEQLKAKTAATTAGLGAEALRRGVSGAAEYGLEKLGKLTPEQMQRITVDPESYKKARSFEELMGEFQDLGQQTRQAGFEARRRGVESLKGLPAISGTDIIPELGNISKGPTMQLSPEELPKMKVRPSKSASELESLLKQKRSLETELQKIQESGIESFEIDKQANELSKKLENVNSKISTSIPSAIQAPFEQTPPTLKDFEKATNIPAELLQARPELADKKIQKELASALKKEIDFLKTGTIEPQNLASYIKNLQEKTSYLAAPSEADKFKQEIARNVSDYLKNLEGAEGYAKGQELSKKAIELEKGFKEFGLGLDSEGNIKVSNPTKVENLYKKGNQKEIDRLNKYIEQAQQLQVDLNVPMQSELIPPSIDKFQTELPLASIRKTVSEAKDLPLVSTAKRAVGSLVGGTVGGIPGAIAGYTGAGLLPTGTKIQEAAAIAKGSDAFKTAAKASKLLGPAAAVLAAGAAFQGAEAAGLEGAEKLGVTAGEVINPIPFTDVTGAYIAGKKEIGKGIVPAAKAAGEAFVKPAKEFIEQPTNIDFSSEALRRMERGEVVPKSAVYKGNLKTSNPEDIITVTQALQNSQDKTSQEYARVLSKLSTASDREKESILFGLNQQPAFRELVRKVKGEQNTEE
jgi:hypothetical protein